MRAYDIIKSKRDGNELSKEEIEFFVSGVTSGSIPDEQIAAFLMAVYFQKMTEKETFILTLAMAHSGAVADFSIIEGFKADKHSTGGVGDKTTLIVAPIVASCGIKVAKMSGRGLGHTGGTIDKLEAFKGFKTSMKESDFVENVKKFGLCIAGQSAELAPADKKLYALRDVTATVDNLSLIASSIMSKKLASSDDGIVLDVTVGSGAFMKDLKSAKELAEMMVKIGKSAGKKTVAVITDMDEPLGYAVGNALEVKEALDVLNGNGPADLKEVSIALAAKMLEIANKGSYEECKKLALAAIGNGTALNKLAQCVSGQGGDADYVYGLKQFETAKYELPVKSLKDGYIEKINAEGYGIASLILGAGRNRKEDVIDMSAGLILNKKTGDSVKSGETLVTLFTNNKDSLKDAEARILNSVKIGMKKPPKSSSILGIVE